MIDSALKLAAPGFWHSAPLHDRIRVRWSPAPYSHLRVHPVLEPRLAARLLSWLQGTRAWRREVQSFYWHDSFELIPEVVPLDVEAAVSPETLSALRGILQPRLGVNLRSFAHVEAHRSTARDAVGVHADAAVDEVRLVVNLNPGWTASRGGLLSLQDRPVQPLHCVSYLPLHNSATAFRTTAGSYHQVSPVREGRRYTVLYRFPINTPAAPSSLKTGRPQVSRHGLDLAQGSRTVIVARSAAPYQWLAA